MALAGPINPLKQHNRAETLQEPLFKIESEVKEVRFGFHEGLLRGDQGQEELAEQKLSITLLI